MTRLELMRLAEDCSDIYTAMETDLMNNIAEYISQGNLDSPTAKWKIQMLAGLGKLDKANIKTIREWATIAPDAQEIALEDAALSAVKEMDNGFAKLAEKGILQGATVPMEDSAMQAMAMYSKQAVSRLNKVNTVMRYFAKNNAGALINNAAEIMSKQEKLDILNKTTGKVVLGAESRQAAVRQCIKEMSAKGIPAFVDAAGRKWTPEAYINMDVRTTCNNVAHEAQFTRMEAYGIDLIEVSSHVGARPKCALDQGRIFDRKNKSEKYPHWKSSSYGEPDGILGINCGHHIYPFVEGVSTQSYFPYDEKENAEAYKQAQKQRQLEREVRTAKRECSMLERLGDEKGLAEAKAHLKQKQDAYFGYCQKSGLKAKRDRLRVEDFDGVLKRKGIDKAGGSGIMESEQQSDLGIFKARLQNDDRVSKEYYSAVKDKFSHGSDTAKRAFTKFVPENSVADANFEGVAHYNTKTKKIHMHYNADLTNERGVCVTYFHEHGHLIDDACGRISQDVAFKKLLDEDYLSYMKQYGKEHKLGTFDKVQNAISNDLSNMRQHSAVSDILQGISKGNINGVAGRKELSYWEGKLCVVSSETFAHMYEAQFDELRHKEMEKYFPNALKYFELKLEEVSK